MKMKCIRRALILGVMMILSGCASEPKQYGVPDRVWSILTEDQKREVIHDYQTQKNKAIQNTREGQKEERLDRVVYPRHSEGRSYVIKTFKWGEKEHPEGQSSSTLGEEEHLESQS